MAVAYSENAVFAKAHAMYGNRLTTKSFDDLLNCKSETELVNYLKTKTQYASILDDVPVCADSVRIEEMLRISLLKKIEVLCKYELSIGENFYKYFIIKNDINQILAIISLLIRGKPEKYLNELPAFFNKHTELDLYEMAKAESFCELLKVLDGTDYKKLLVPYENIYKNKGVYLQIEAAMNKYLRQFLAQTVRHYTRKKERKQIYNIINYKFDLDAVVSISRLKNFPFDSSVAVRNYVNTEFTNFSEKEQKELLQISNINDAIAFLANFRYGKDFSEYEFDYLEGVVQRMIFKHYEKNMRYSANAAAVMFCYVWLAENEINNIVKILEGIKYGISPEKIKAVLIGI